MYVEDLLAIGDTELSSFFFYDSEGNRLFYMIPMLVFVFSGFLSVTFICCMGTSGPVCGNFEFVWMSWVMVSEFTVSKLAYVVSCKRSFG